MPLFLYLNSFRIYNIMLIFIFSIIVSNNLPSFLSTSFYCIFYLIIIYISIYSFKKSLFLIFFLYGLLLDIFLLNEIGPHLLTFILSLSFLSSLFKFLSNLTSVKVYFFIILFQIFMLSIQITISNLLFDISFNIINLMEVVLITLILSFPIFIIFAKIDKFK